MVGRGSSDGGACATQRYLLRTRRLRRHSDCRKTCTHPRPTPVHPRRAPAVKAGAPPRGRIPTGHQQLPGSAIIASDFCSRGSDSTLHPLWTGLKGPYQCQGGRKWRDGDQEPSSSSSPRERAPSS